MTRKYRNYRRKKSAEVQKKVAKGLQNNFCVLEQTKSERNPPDVTELAGILSLLYAEAER
jgi:hypothetical protein